GSDPRGGGHHQAGPGAGGRAREARGAMSGRAQGPGPTGSVAESLRAVARGSIRENEPLAPRSSIRLGGSADLWFEPARIDHLLPGLKLFKEQGLPVRVLGGGSNTLISDAGLRGAIIHLTPGFAAGATWVGDREVELPAGLSGIKALQAARSRGLTGP